ncbi:class D sortase [Paenalkalicoccus suaedae]|uniref:Class D sortase n=1 Tax=Paenalkalicoccus suaedae TaxID=2592382 RepID=A0A859FE86_9BACI|nr:class D sortase [Paenalkalicoccus suaedae]QKS70904.1 class D sortase [Paenalkalicoccus suaedae]
MRITALIMIVLGLLFMSTPLIKAELDQQKEQALLKEFEELSAIFDQKIREDVYEGPHTEGVPLVKEDETDVIGLLSIDSIELTLPIRLGTTNDILKSGAGLMTESTPLDKRGNSAIAAHRQYKYGVQFNRLNEVRRHDLIEVEQVNGDKRTYQVEHISRVLPDEMHVIKEAPGPSLLTLITCDPMINPTHRLIVQAKEIDY